MKSSKVLCLLSLLLFAQLSFADAFSDAIGRRARSREDAKVESAKLIQLAKAKLANTHHAYEIVNGGAGDTAREALVLIPNLNGGPLNQLAKFVQDESPGVRVVYDAYPLLFGTVAFFDPKALTLGISHNAMAKLASDEAIEHERYHARTYLSSLRGKAHSLAGELSTLKQGERLSPYTDKGYFYFQGLDEGVTQALSLALKTQTLERRIKAQEKGLDLQWELTILNLDADMCTSVSRQVESIAAQILAQSQALALNEVSRVDVNGKTFAQLTLYFRAYKSYQEPSENPKSGALKLSFAESEFSRLNEQGLRSRLERIRDQSKSLASQCLNIEKLIPMGIERAEVSRTNVPAVIEAARLLQSNVNQVQ